MKESHSWLISATSLPRLFFRSERLKTCKQVNCLIQFFGLSQLLCCNVWVFWSESLKFCKQLNCLLPILWPISADPLTNLVFRSKLLKTCKQVNCLIQFFGLSQLLCCNVWVFRSELLKTCSNFIVLVFLLLSFSCFLACLFDGDGRVFFPWEHGSLQYLVV